MAGYLTRVARVVVALAVSVVTVAAQTTTADVNGSVIDSTGAVLVGAAVSIVNTLTGPARSVVTDPTGRFKALGLAVGTYTITASTPGFQDASVVVDLRLADTKAVMIGLRPAASAEVVVAASARTDLRRMDVSAFVSREALDELPLNLRGTIGLARVAGGPVGDDRAGQQGSAESSGLSFLWQRGRSNALVVDRLEASETAVGGFRRVFS